MVKVEQAIQIDSARLWQSLAAMAEVGATAEGGCNRQALTALDGRGRDLFVSWCMDIGLQIRIDRLGNIFARKLGLNPALAPVLTGSHLDTQPTGGKFDGVLGVLAGLEALRSLSEQQCEHQRSIDVVVWTNEEGARFTPAMLGSGVWAGVFSEAQGLAREDAEGISVAHALSAIGYDGKEPAQAFPVHAAFELHIEQGPILEQQAKSLGVVAGVQGIRWYDLRLQGQSCHAGPTPMEGRRDPMQVVAKIINRLYLLVSANGEWARVTFGDIHVAPGARNTVPESLDLSIDLRHPEQSTLQAMEQCMREIIAEEAELHGVGWELALHWDSPAVAFDSRCVEWVRDSVVATGEPWLELYSGAGHDSVYVSKVAPTAMIFIPCKGGLSHNAAESINQEQAALGAQVLTEVLFNAANT